MHSLKQSTNVPVKLCGSVACCTTSLVTLYSFNDRAPMSQQCFGMVLSFSQPSPTWSEHPCPCEARGGVDSGFCTLSCCADGSYLQSPLRCKLLKEKNSALCIHNSDRKRSQMHIQLVFQGVMCTITCNAFRKGIQLKTAGHATKNQQECCNNPGMFRTALVIPRITEEGKVIFSNGSGPSCL